LRHHIDLINILVTAGNTKLLKKALSIQLKMLIVSFQKNLFNFITCSTVDSIAIMKLLLSMGAIFCKMW